MKLDRRSLAVAAAGLSAFLNLYTTQAVLPMLAREFDASPALTGMTVSASTLGVALAAPLAGLAAERWGRKRVIVGGIVLMALPTLLAGTAGSIGALIGWRFLQGLFLPAAFAVTTAHVSEQWEPGEAADVLGIMGAGLILGGYSGRSVMSYVAEVAGWRWGFPALALMTLAAGVVVALWLPPDRPAPSHRPSPAGAGRTAAWDLLRNPALLSTCAVGFAILFSMVAIFTYSGFRLAAPPLGYDSSTIAHVFAVFLLGIPAMPTTGPAIRRFGRPRVITGAVALKALGLAFSLAGSLPLITIGLALFSMGTFISQPTAIGFAGIASPHSRSVAVGLYVSAYYLGGTLGGVAPAWLWERYGWTGCVVMVAAVDLVALGLALTTWRRPLPHLDRVTAPATVHPAPGSMPVR